MNKLFCSTGTMVGKLNGYDYTLILKHFPDLFEKELIGGGEFIVLKAYYENLYKICTEIKSTSVPFDVIHCDKDIGIMFSEENDKITNEAFLLLQKNCEAAEILGCTRMVFHLWGGIKSDTNITYNISLIPKILDITKKFNVKLMIENIPCTHNSGLENWRKIYKFMSDIEFVFDTRFGAFHDEIDKILDEPIWNKITHIHISDYGGDVRDFSKIRPILHPGEGKIDFEHIFSELCEKSYNGTFTLESPVMNETGINSLKLERTLNYLQNIMKKYNLKN